VRRWIEQHDAELVQSEYGMSVRLVVRMPAVAREPAAAELRDLTNGRAAVEVKA
jgi:hypothetical protein